MPFSLRVEGFGFGETIPKRHTCEGEDVSPAMEWSDVPAGTRSFALIVDDPDAPAGTWNHWLLWDIAAGERSLPEKARLGVSGTNDFGRRGYGGPCPPRGHGLHRYFFHLYAVEADSLGLAAGSRRAEMDRALRRQKTTETTYMGRYER
jgi:hypothetical protein